ncbi:MAG TPA: TolC family protein [Longimicrobiales bacterium]|nr:TolC family protein [Longimicrobiales bacterium]
MKRGMWLWLAVVLGAQPASGQQPVRRDTVQLSLPAALEAALTGSEEVRVAEAQVEQAVAQVRATRASLLPQISTQLVYTKTLRSVFQNTGFEIPDSLRFEPDSLASIQERLRYLEQKTPNAAFGALGGLFADLPFGRENMWIAGAQLSQPLFAGGRISAGVALSELARDAASAALDDARAEIAFQVKEAYYNAALAAEAEAIVGGSVTLAEDHLANVRLQFEAGRASELEVLRAEVELENLRPQLVQARNARQLSLLNLKRLVNVPIDAPVSLATQLSPTDAALPAPDQVRFPALPDAEPQLGRRAGVRAARLGVAMREEQAGIARGAFLPSVALTGNFQRQAFPGGFLPEEWRDDWNVGFAVSWPLFQGFRRSAELALARAQVRQAELQVEQLLEGVRLSYEQALGELAQARAQIAAATRAAQQAERVYDLTQLRYTEGLATQLDVSSARLVLQQARMNEVTAFRDFYVAVARAERALGIDASTLMGTR